MKAATSNPFFSKQGTAELISLTCPFSSYQADEANKLSIKGALLGVAFLFLSFLLIFFLIS